MAMQSMQARLAEQGEEANIGTSDAFNRFIAAEVAKYAKIVDIAKIARE